jgi:hypothetical protein
MKNSTLKHGFSPFVAAVVLAAAASLFLFAQPVTAGHLGRMGISAIPERALTPTDVIDINCGGAAAPPYVADTDFGGGSTSSTKHAITTTGLIDPAPQAVYKTARYGNFTYTIGGLTAGAAFTVRLHFDEFNFNSSGSRLFNVSINGTTVLVNFDIYKTAGGEYIAVIEPFGTVANSAGQIVIQFTSVVNNAIVEGIQIEMGSAASATLSPENATSLYLWASGTSSGSPVEINSDASYWNVAAAESFHYIELSSGPYCVQSDSLTSGSGEEIWPCDGAVSQDWNMVADAAPAGYYQFQQGVAGDLLCLDATSGAIGSVVETVTCNSSAGQQWLPSAL